MEIILDVHDGSTPGQETGKRPILVAESALCEECGREHELEKCPDCGSWVEPGYGLAFGGYGEYKSCLKNCGWFWKKEDSGE